jgi:hypothetical protein
MRELANYQRTEKLKRGNAQESTIQLTFHIPQDMRIRAEVIIEVRSIPHDSIVDDESYIELESPKKTEALNILEFDENCEPIISTSEKIEINSVSVATAEVLSYIGEVKVEISEIIDDVIPFFSLNLKNSESVYKIGTSFLKDISKGHKHFGFISLSKYPDDLHLLVYGSFINYSLKQPVLIVVRDMNDKSLDRYRQNFTEGTLWKWKTIDWGNVCLIDYNQINCHSEEFKNSNLNFITQGFAAVLWALPSGDVQNELQKGSLEILSKINSVTYIVSKGETKNKILKKSAAYYQCFNIPLKGILIGEGLK